MESTTNNRCAYLTLVTRQDMIWYYRVCYYAYYTTYIIFNWVKKTKNKWLSSYLCIFLCIFLKGVTHTLKNTSLRDYLVMSGSRCCLPIVILWKSNKVCLSLDGLICSSGGHITMLCRMFILDRPNSERTSQVLVQLFAEYLNMSGVSRNWSSIVDGLMPNFRSSS